MRDKSNLQVELAWNAAECFAIALAQHREQMPADCERIISMVGEGTASPIVLCEAGAPIRVGYRMIETDKIVIVASFPLGDTPPNWIH